MSAKLIRQLTDSLQEVEARSYTPSESNNNGLEFRSHSSDNTSLLYRYGHEIDRKSQKPFFPTIGLSSSGNISTVPNVMSADKLQTSVSIAEDDGATLHTLATAANKGKNLKFVSGSQFRMLGKPQVACQQCDVLDKSLRKSKETIRSLRVQLARMEESFKDLKFSKSIESLHTESKTASDFDFKSNDDVAVSRKINYLEDEVAKLKKLLSFERSTNDALRQSLEEARSNNTAEYDKALLDIDALKKTFKRKEVENNDLREVVADLELTISALRKQIDDSEALRAHQLRSEIDPAELLKEIDRLRKELDKLETTNKAYQSNLSNKNVIITSLEAKVQSLTATLSSAESSRDAIQIELNSQSGALKTAQEQLQQMKKRCEVVEALGKTTTTERDTLKHLLQERESELKEKCKKLECCEQEVASLTSKINDLLRRMTAESETTKRALEKAITASVKLCVVAPTVNVHVSDSKHKFKSRMSDAALKQFLSNEIFDKYSFLYKQQSENTAPNGEGLESWLQKMLSQMQRAIENHVNSAMDGSSM